jgi:hypothetical protein
MGGTRPEHPWFFDAIDHRLLVKFVEHRRIWKRATVLV